MEGHRYERVADSIREEIVEMIAYELDDVRLQGVEVVDVQVSPDMKKCMISVITPAEGEEQEKILQVLRGTKGFLKSELAQRLDLYRMPELYFDPALDLGPKNRVKSLLKRVRRGRAKDGDEEAK